MDNEINKVILEIRAGAGGEEASLFAAELARMYQRFADIKNWRFEIIDFSLSALRGYKTFIAEISGPGVFRLLKNESGVHRVQRIPVTEKTGRVHTSTVSVAVLPEPEPQVVQIDPRDLEISFFRSSGPGGQNVNKVETAVRIRHIPSGLVVASQNERSQSQNREKAMAVLRAKLYEKKQEEQNLALSGLRKQQIGLAKRAEKIRTYNFPQDRVTDHRLNKKWHHLEKILDGDLEPIIASFN